MRGEPVRDLGKLSRIQVLICPAIEGGLLESGVTAQAFDEPVELLRASDMEIDIDRGVPEQATKIGVLLAKLASGRRKRFGVHGEQELLLGLEVREQRRLEAAIEGDQRQRIGGAKVTARSLELAVELRQQRARCRGLDGLHGRREQQAARQPGAEVRRAWHVCRKPIE